jgi:hypothetical protein
MASFDVESLFTNIPLHETIDICIRLLYSNTNLVLNLTADLFKELLRLAVLNTLFIFNDVLYQQTEGLGMGLPLGPTFANIFMCFHEINWLNDCPLLFRPVFYKRYIDDTFLLFKHHSHVNLFLDYLNSKHPNIKFTFESESNNKISFLDIAISRHSNSFHCSVYRKPTFTGLGSSFFSFCTLKFKITSIQTLVYRAYNVCSNYTSLHSEFEFLRNFFKSNGYPSFLVEKYIKRFLHSTHITKPIDYTVMKLPFYISLPFFGYQSEKLKSELSSLLSRTYPYVDFHLILSNSFKTSSLFRFKDRLPKSMSASVVYEFSCALGSAPVSYIGMTKRHLHKRVAEHAGRSARSNKPLSNPPHSSIRLHSTNCSCNISLDNFKILTSANNDTDLRILESLYIYKKRPPLNEMLSSHPLLTIQ